MPVDSRIWVDPGAAFSLDSPMTAMRKTLYLVRHAKALSSGSLEDHERPLSEQGESEAREIGRLMVREGWIPNGVMCSTAIRARETARLLCGELGIEESRMILAPELFHAEAGKLMWSLRKRLQSEEAMLVVGHNPGITDVANLLIQGTGIGDMPTASLVVLDLELETWQDLRGAKGERRAFAIPGIGRL